MSNQPILTHSFTCYLSFEIGTITGTARRLFHNNEMIKLSFTDIVKAQELLPHIGSRARLVSLASWESQYNYSIDTIQKKLEFKGATPYLVHCYSDGSKRLVNKSKAA